MIRGDVVRRVTSSPVVIDWLPVLVVPVVLVVDASLSSQGKPLTVISVGSAFVACLPLALRRRVSFPVMFPLIVGGVILTLWLLHPGNTVVLIPMVALFELALNGDRRRSLWMSVAVVPCVLISILPFASGLTHIASLVVRNLVLCVLAIAAGDILRSRRLSAQRVVEAHEQQTLRRVGQERLQIAREIHDVVAHAMTAINVQAGVAAHLLERDPGQAYEALRNIKHTSGAALTDLRATLDVLRDPSQAAPLGPQAGLAEIAELTEGLSAAGVAVDLAVERVDDVPAAVQSAGFRIVQEALTNVARHAHAATARVGVRRVPGAVVIEVVDDGVGARRSNGHVNGDLETSGNGVRGMRERAAALGGTLDAEPVDDGGWRVRARLPVGTSEPDPVAQPMITVELADDQSLVRAGFHALLDAEPEITVVAEAADGESAVALARRHRPQVVLMDIRMPRMDGLEATAQITGDADLAETRVVVLTTFELDEYVFGALRAGASGFLLKDVEPADLVTAVRVVASGDALLAPRLTRRLIEAFVAGSAIGPADPSTPAGRELDKLTPREREVLVLVGRGKSNAEIAERLVLSPLTAKTHVARLFSKLGARDRAQLVVAAYESGLIVAGRDGAGDD